MTYLQYKERIELSRGDYQVISERCFDRGIQWFASPWDRESVSFLEDFGVPCHKVASASLTDLDLLKAIRDTGRPVILSTGMSTLEEIDSAVATLGTGSLILAQSTSTYPAKPHQLNLRAIATLRDRYQRPVGYSGHETGLQTTVAAVAMGACLVERHVTLDRSMWGTDQAASVEPSGLKRLVRDIRTVEEAMGDGIKSVIEEELPIRAKLRLHG